jgi:hypothetical protein
VGNGQLWVSHQCDCDHQENWISGPENDFWFLLLSLEQGSSSYRYRELE